jgi:hypothetical protein
VDAGPVDVHDRFVNAVVLALVVDRLSGIGVALFGLSDPTSKLRVKDGES